MSQETTFVKTAISNTVAAAGMDAKYPLGVEHFDRPDGSYIEFLSTAEVVDMLQALTWTDITENLSDDCKMGETRYYSAELPSKVQAFEAAVHFAEYLDLIEASDDVRQGKQPVPGLQPFVAFHKGCQLTSTILKPQPTTTVVLAVGLSEWKEELKWGSHWHSKNGDPRQDLQNCKIFFWAPGRVLPPSSTVKLLRS